MNERLVNCERVLFFWEKSYDITINCLYRSLQNLFRLEYLRIELFWSIRTRAHHYYWSATTIGWSYPLNCYRRPCITSRATNRLVDNVVIVDHAIILVPRSRRTSPQGCEYGGEVCDRSRYIRILIYRLLDTNSGTS